MEFVLRLFAFDALADGGVGFGEAALLDAQVVQCGEAASVGWADEGSPTLTARGRSARIPAIESAMARVAGLGG